jgi:predicted phosphodiesterase
MRYLVLSDIHSNIEALSACLERAKSAKYDKVLCCGDLVGYGPNPLEVIDNIRALDAVVIRGNHDRVACGLDDAMRFNPHAARAIYWTRSALSESGREYLAKLPIGPVSVTQEAQLVHGAIRDEDDYIFTEAEAEENFALTKKQVTFFGHSHFPMMFETDERGHARIRADCSGLNSDSGSRFLVNPGSVGQPRDGDVRASFAVWDEGQRRIEFYRVEYDLRLTQKKMAEAHLPEYLIERLGHGR